MRTLIAVCAAEPLAASSVAANGLPNHRRHVVSIGHTGISNVCSADGASEGAPGCDPAGALLGLGAAARAPVGRNERPPLLLAPLHALLHPRGSLAPQL